MERQARILVVGIGGVGATWASHAHRDGPDGMDLMIVDADPRSFEGRDGAHRIRLGAEGDDAGCAALPELAEQRLRLHVDAVEAMASTMELVIVIAALGGGVGSGATKELVDAVRRTGALVIALTAMPFPSQQARVALAESVLPSIRFSTHLTVRIDLERAAAAARKRGSDWRHGSPWVRDLVQGLATSLLHLGLINLDPMDLRSVVARPGAATMVVGEGDASDAEGLLVDALRAPLTELRVEDGRGCYLHIEGGRALTVGQVDAIARAFTDGLDEDAQIILGARISPGLGPGVRVLAIVSGVPELQLLGDDAEAL